MNSLRRQRGAVLIVGLVMLVLLTMMAISSFKAGKSNFVVVNTQQIRAEANRSAEQVIEQLVANTSVNLANGSDLFGGDVSGAGLNVIVTDVNGDGTGDYEVTVATPVCVKRRVVPQSTLDITVSDDLGCMSSVDQASLGIEGSGSSDSICSEVVWDVTATATDRFSGDVQVAVVQGLGQRVATTLVATVCD